MFSYSRSKDRHGELTAGRYCSIAPGLSFSDIQHPLDRVSTHPFTASPILRSLARKEFGVSVETWNFHSTDSPPTIGHDVWIGRDVTIKRGVRIGHGAVIGERAFVTRDVPPYAIVAGIPARIIRYRFPEELINRLLSVGWWRFNYTDFAGLDTRRVEAFIDGVAEREERRAITEVAECGIAIADGLEAHLAEGGAKARIGETLKLLRRSLRNRVRRTIGRLKQSIGR